MKIIRQLSRDEMIGEFLKAELNSSRFSQGTLKGLKMLNFHKDIVENLDYSNKKHNEQRAKLLNLTRGWLDEWLFTNFPKNTKWSQVSLSKQELLQAYRLKSRQDMPKSERLLANTANAVAMA